MSNKSDIKQKAYENLIYAYKRIDILVITISISGMYLLTQNSLPEDCLIKYAFLFFILTLLANLISQFTSVYTNKFDYNSITTKEAKTSDRLDRKSKFLSDATETFTIASGIFLTIALLLLLFCFWRSRWSWNSFFSA